MMQPTFSNNNRDEPRFQAIFWSLFLVWLGIYFMIDIPKPGLFSLGLGTLLLFENLLRRLAGSPVSRFWVTLGVLLLAMGILDFFSLRLVPFFLIVAGIVIFVRFASSKSEKAFDQN